MRSPRPLVPVALLALAAAFGAVPSPAAAKPHQRSTPRLRGADFKLKGTNGFRVAFGLSGHLLFVNAIKGSSSVSYAVGNAEVDGDRFAGRLPGIGGVSVRFDQHGKTKRQSNGCKGEPTLIRSGEFTGTIRLRGEMDYTRVGASHASGTVIETPKGRCRTHRPSIRPRPLRPTAKSTGADFVELTAKAGPVEVQAFQSIAEKGLEISLLAASRSRRHDGMVVSSSVLDITSSPDVLLTADTAFPEVATVEPPRPFSGSAEFGLLGPHSSTWTGDLSVTLAGVGPVRLAGPSFRSKICLGKKCKGSLQPPSGSPESEFYRR
jgi:hypothetical protein